jgi:tetratricopeptide (TPR) repeat protein
MRKHLPKIGLLSLMVLAAMTCHNTDVLGQQRQSIEEKEHVEAHSDFIEGVAAFENKDFRKALDLLNSAYVKLPDHPGVNFALADAYFQINDLDNAAYYGKQAAKLDPQNRWYHLKLVEVYRAAGKSDAAINELTTALEYHPDDKDILFKLARTYSNDGQYLKANDIYNKIINLDGETINIRLEKLTNFNKLNMRDSAIVELQKIRTLDPDNLSTLQVLSNYYIEIGKLDEAREVLKNALDINKTDPQTLIMLSDIYMSEAQWDSVGTTLGNVIQDPTVSSKTKTKVARYLYSKFNANKENTDIRNAASTVFQHLMQSDARSGESLELAADFFAQTQQNPLALQALERINKLIPTDDTAWQQRLQLLLDEGKIKEAISVGELAAEQIPQDPIILYFLGNAYLSNQEHTQAIEKLEEASRLPARRPLKANIHGSLGNAYAALDNWDTAFEQYDKSLNIESGNPDILKNYAYYLSLQKQELDKAEGMARKAVELDPQNSSYLDTLGWIYYQKNEFEKARKYIQQAIDTGQANAEVLEHMGEVMNKLNKPQEAKKWWQKALEKDSTRSHLKTKLSD